ncbi:MAG: hypothetical protein IJX03_05965 [Clostridia bacterium]|nr:hypothetical protein [Clostridia bacterium]
MIKVYYCVVTEFSCDEELIKSLPTVRQEYVNSITDKKRQAQSVYVWKLLEYALNKDFNLKLIEFYQNLDGAWALKKNEVFFSLAHSKNIVAVAVSNVKPIGIDVEQCSDKILKVEKILNAKCENFSKIDALTLQWTKKESLYKAKSGKNYSYIKIGDNCGNSYYLTVCFNDDKIEFNNIDVKEIYKI